MIRHLYVHLPFCAHRCGYCDFVTAVGREGEHERYVDALLAELEFERGLLAPRLETIFLGGGTPTFTRPEALARLLSCLPAADEVTVEANPDDGDAGPGHAVARRRRHACVAGRAELHAEAAAGARAERPARRRPAARSTLCVMPILTTSRSTSSTGFPARAPPTSRATSTRRSRSSRTTFPVTSSRPSRGRASPIPSGMSSRARPTRWRLFRAGRRPADRRRLPLVRDGNFCRPGAPASRRITGRVTTSRTGTGTTTSAWAWARCRRSVRNAGGTHPVSRATSEALAAGRTPPREIETLDGDVRSRERVMLGLRLDEPLALAGLEAALDADALARLERLGLAARTGRDDATTLALTRRGRFLSAVASRPSCSRDPPRGRVQFPLQMHVTEPELTARQRQILRLVIDEYVATGQPVGSKGLVERGGMDVSPSTVRNEFSALESLGLLTHPHTSAGACRPSAATASTRRACWSASSCGRVRSRSTSPASARRSTLRCRRRPRSFRRSRGCSRSCPRLRSRRRPSSTSKSCSCSRTSSWSS